MFRGPFRAYVVVSLLLGTGAAASGQDATPPFPSELESIRDALRKYEDPIVAVHDGYFSTLGCVEIVPAEDDAERIRYPAGSMGVHFLNPAAIGPELDPSRPQILLYEPVEGGLRLVGAEWFVPLATGVAERPVLFGQPFDGPMEGHHPLMPEGLHHWDLHVWLFKPNPNGLFSPTHADLSCDGYTYRTPEIPPRVVSLE